MDTFILGMTARIFRAGKALPIFFLLFEDPRTPDLRVYVSDKQNILELLSLC